MKTIAGLILSPLLASFALASDLMQIYQEALASDPTFASARAALDAGREKTPQARAGLLPALSVTGNSTWNKNEISTHDGPTLAKPNYNSNGYQLTLSQPLFRWQNWVSYNQSKIQVAQAEATFVQARQDLILRTSQAYFDVIYAIENLKAVRANKAAISQQLQSAKKNFEVGTTTITDTHEAQARFDLAVAQEITAESDYEVRMRTLQAIIGKEPGNLATVRNDLALTSPQPNDMSQWVSSAEKDSISVQIQQAISDITGLEEDKQRAGHYPTVDLVANKGYSKNYASTSGLTDTDYQNIGVQVTIPLFQGGLTTSRQREATANRYAAQSALDEARRKAALSARQYYLGVTNGLAQVKALKAALVSSQSALDSNKLGYKVGIRINIDVLNAENQVFVTRRDLAKVTLDTLMAQLRLKAATGALGEDDVAQINALLDSSSAL